MRNFIMDIFTRILLGVSLKSFKAMVAYSVTSAVDQGLAASEMEVTVSDLLNALRAKRDAQSQLATAKEREAAALRDKAERLYTGSVTRAGLRRDKRHADADIIDGQSADASKSAAQFEALMSRIVGGE